MMVRDYGSGLTFDDLIGMRAEDIDSLALPNVTLAHSLSKAVDILIDHGYGLAMLVELWGDGHSVWQRADGGGVVVVTPTGQLNPPEA